MFSFQHGPCFSHFSKSILFPERCTLRVPLHPPLLSRSASHAHRPRSGSFLSSYAPRFSWLSPFLLRMRSASNKLPAVGHPAVTLQPLLAAVPHFLSLIFLVYLPPSSPAPYRTVCRTLYVSSSRAIKAFVCLTCPFWPVFFGFFFSLHTHTPPRPLVTG